jgi:hypothetical protein
MITKDNFENVLTSIGAEKIYKALNAKGDYVLVELMIFNTGGVATITSCQYDEDAEIEAAANGNLFLDKSDFIMLMSEFKSLVIE